MQRDVHNQNTGQKTTAELAKAQSAVVQEDFAFNR